MADSVEFDESAVRKCVVDGASTLAEEVWPVRARHYEDGRVYVEIIRKLVLFDGTIHLDDLFGEFHTVRLDRPFRQPRVKVVDSIGVEDLLNVAFHSLSALTVLDESAIRSARSASSRNSSGGTAGSYVMTALTAASIADSTAVSAP